MNPRTYTAYNTYKIREFINNLDNWLDNKIGQHNPVLKEWSYTFEEDDNQLKINLLIDIEGEINE